MFLAADAAGLRRAPGLSEFGAFGQRDLLDDETLVVVLPAILAGMAPGDTLGAVQGDWARRLSRFQRLPVVLFAAGWFAAGGARAVGGSRAQSRAEEAWRRGPR